MLDVLLKLLGVLALGLPVLAVRWNMAGVGRRRSTLLAPENRRMRWRLEIYSTDPEVERVLVDPAEVPFPAKRVRSVKAERADRNPEMAWALPRVELDVEVADPLTDESLTGLFGTEHRVRFVTGNEAVVETRAVRARVCAFRFDWGSGYDPGPRDTTAPLHPPGGGRRWRPYGRPPSV